MIDKEHVKEVLEEELDWVKYRIKILDLIEEKLFQMRELVRFTVNNYVTQKELQKINKRLENLTSEVKLLDAQRTYLS